MYSGRDRQQKLLDFGQLFPRHDQARGAEQVWPQFSMDEFRQARTAEIAPGR